MILSGMSSLEQMAENTATLSVDQPLTQEGHMGLDIPSMIAAYNEVRFQPGSNVGMRFDALPLDKRPAACIACGKCSQACPQGIDVPSALKGLAEAIEKTPSWADICKQREQEAKQNRS